MKIIKLKQETLTKEQFEKKLEVKIDKWIVPKDGNFLKLYCQDKIIFLRCDDIKRLFGLEVNLFDQRINLNKKHISFKVKEEIYRGKVKPIKKIRQF